MTTQSSRSNPRRPPGQVDAARNALLGTSIALPSEWQPPEPDSPRGRIVSSARLLFSEKGLEATSIRDITDFAKVNSAMVHYYFKNKEELYRRVLGYEMLAVFRSIHEQVEPDTTSGELLLGMPARVMRVVHENPVWARLLSREISSGAANLQRVISELQDFGPLGIRQRAEAVYKEAVRRGEVRDLPMVYVIQFLLVIAYSGVFYGPFFRVIGRHDPDQERYFGERLKTFDTLLRHGLLPDRKPK